MLTGDAETEFVWEFGEEALEKGAFTHARRSRDHEGTEDVCYGRHEHDEETTRRRRRGLDTKGTRYFYKFASRGQVIGAINVISMTKYRMPSAAGTTRPGISGEIERRRRFWSAIRLGLFCTGALPPPHFVIPG